MDDHCSIPATQIYSGGPGKDGIPALTNPEMGFHRGRGTEYLRDSDRVIGLVLGSDTMAIPINIMWWHEIVNLDIGGWSLAVTHCPLTGSSMAFDRGPANDAEFGVSGLLYQNNLIMYDRNTNESLWPQMLAGARCGVSDGTLLPMRPVMEMTWGAWRELYPNTQVVTDNTGFFRDYRFYPYGNYDEPNNTELLFPLVDGIDSRRPPKERVLGIAAPGGGMAFPFGALADDNSTALAAVHERVNGNDIVVFWDADRATAMAYYPEADGTPLTFTGHLYNLLDAETGSVWRVGGVAVEGPLAGTRLQAVSEAYVAYWFAWAAFNVTGQPAMSVPLSRNAQGLPIGLHFAGRYAEEATLFRLASQLEQACPWFDQIPAWVREG